MNNRARYRKDEGRGHKDEGAAPFVLLPPSSLILHPSSLKRRRRKRHLAWEQAELASGGFYARNLEAIARRYPALTPMELRVCALVKAMLPSWRIAEILGVCEYTIENHRVNIRRKMCLNSENLAHHLSTL